MFLFFTASADVEHYDIDNASSIAPSDIDIVYHYKGYRGTGGGGAGGGPAGSGGRLPKKRNKQHINTPLARLSPSSEMSRNTPRILTLGDLSGKPLPSSLGGGEGGSRALGSPVNSHISSVSRNAPGGGGLTESNVARFNNQRASHSNSNSNAPTPVQVNAMGQNSALVNTLDLVSAANAFKSMAF